MNRAIRRVAVLGSGVMGSRIACHFAGIGVQVLLLDIVPRDLNDAEKAAGKTLEDKAVRNRIVNDALAATLKGKPSAVYTKQVATHVKTGNFDDNLKDISGCDWIIEAVVERLDIKQQLLEKVEQVRKPGTLITTNTSGIPIHMIAEGRSEDFQQNFCGSHFFNPPRYLRLLEIIPGPKTKPEVISFLLDYGERFLGKTTVLCKDTPAFIANRVGVFGFMAVFNAMQQLDMNVDEIDSLTGTIFGRPKSATFRTGDVVGLDTLVHVAKALPSNAPNDEAKGIFKLPSFLEKMVENKWLGDKTGQGFYKKTKIQAPVLEPAPFTESPENRGDEKKVKTAQQNAPRPETVILTLNLATMEYGPKQKSKFATLEAAKQIDDLPQRLKVFTMAQTRPASFTSYSITCCSLTYLTAYRR